MIAVSYHDRVNVLQAMGLASAAPFEPRVSGFERRGLIVVRLVR